MTEQKILPAPLDRDELLTLVRLALDEDLRYGPTSLLPQRFPPMRSRRRRSSHAPRVLSPASTSDCLFSTR